MTTRELLLKQLNETMAQVLGVYESIEDPDMAVHEDWTAKDVLGHITFWHESFARNASDMVKGIKPTPLKGSYSDLTQRCFDEMRPQAVEEIIRRLEVAHGVIQETILDARLSVIPYKKGSRDYSPEEHLAIVDTHIQEHLREVKKAGKNRS